MKKVMLIIAIAAIATVSGCKKKGCTDRDATNYCEKCKTENSTCKYNPCYKVICNNAGTCIDGTCSCPLAYEGKNCETEMRMKYFGNYNGSLTATSGGKSTSATDNVIVSTYLGNILRIDLEGGLYGEFTSKTNFTIPQQTTYENGNYIKISGNGSFSGSQLIMNYTVILNGIGVTASFTGTK